MAKPYMCGDDLPVYVPEGGCDCNYTITESHSNEYARVYNLMLNGTEVGDTITVPKDEYIEDCKMQVVSLSEVPYAGAVVGDYYLDFTYKNNASHIYVPLSDLTGGGYLIVDELPEEGNSHYIYLIDDGHGSYERYVWSDGDWVDIGGTNISLSDYYTKSEIDGMLQNIMLRIYPVGSIYIGTSSANPGTVFGGTWVQVKDRFLLAAGDTYTEGDTGGSATETLSIGNLPSHTHNFSATFRNRATDYASSSNLTWSGTNVSVTRSSTTGDPVHQVSGAVKEWAVNIQGDTTSVGSGNAHNNMPPYLVVYVWQRTA